MSGVFLNLDSHEVSQALRDLQRLLLDTGPLMSELGEIVLTQTQDSFEKEKSPAGEPWLKSQRSEIDNGQTLVDSSQLLGSLSNEVDILPDSVTVGSSKVYAAIHQLGGQAGRGHHVEIPARPYLPDEKTVDMEEVGASIEAYFEEAFK